MEILKEILTLDENIRSAQKLVEEAGRLKAQWINENRKKIKEFWPIPGKMYKIKDHSWWANHWSRKKEMTDDTYYFIPKNTPLYAITHVGFPKVNGVVVDCSKILVFDYTEAEITNLEPIDESQIPDLKLNAKTFIYIMIDKNTGYYKIGRSVRPGYRERTLQSEKPTIVMIYNQVARVRDEAILHKMFSEKRVRGEWFDLSGSDIEKIKQYLSSITAPE